MNAITINDLTKSFGKLAVLKGINLTIKSGEIFTLLGENGAGKSTLINILTTLLQADHGEVRVLGYDPRTQGNQVRQHISLNSQAITLDQEFTGYENLRLIAELRGVANPQQVITDLAQRLALTSFLKRKVATYSGGMQRRLDIAMSLIGDPEIIFLDEPTTGVDPKNRLELWQIIRDIRQAGKTVFLTTQYLEEADQLADQIAFLHDGRIVRSGTPAELKRTVSQTYSLIPAQTDLARTTQLLTQAKIAYQQQETTISLAATVMPAALNLLLSHQIQIKHLNLDETNLETIFLQTTSNEVPK